jgi:probable F420-dependent oxidoreductase
VKLGTGVLVLPYRHPVATAKAIATIDVLSGGRVLFGIGVGWLFDEFAALELKPFDDRGAVTDEQLQIFKALWTQERPSFDGRFYRFPEISVTPLPAQRPHPPILVGGNSRPALRRTVAYGDGWHALMLLPRDGRAQRLQAMAADAGGPTRSRLDPRRHPPDQGRLRSAVRRLHRRQSMTGTVEQVVDQLVAYRDAGVEEIHTLVSTDDAYGRGRAWTAWSCSSGRWPAPGPVKGPAYSCTHGTRRPVQPITADDDVIRDAPVRRSAGAAAGLALVTRDFPAARDRASTPRS